MKTRNLILYLFLCLCIPYVSSAQEAFVPGFEDLPLADGLVPGDEEMAFDTPAGRIVESYATSNTLSSKEVFDFYASTLPQLGWNTLSSGTFTRDGERLSIETHSEDGVINVRFFLQPDRK